MIKEPPRLTLYNISRWPDPDDVAALGGYPTGQLVDAMEGVGALGAEIRAVAPEALTMRMAGAALTCACAPADVLGVMAALHHMRPGAVLAQSTGAWRGCAAAGDRVLGMAKNGGSVGYVTDGLIRDVAGVIDVGLPAFAAGASPNSPFTCGPGSVGGPVTLGERQVETGDVIVGDRDGVVVVPFADIARVRRAVAEVAAHEAALDQQVAEGLAAPPWVADLLNGPETRRL